MRKRTENVKREEMKMDREAKRLQVLAFLLFSTGLEFDATLLCLGKPKITVSVYSIY